MTVNVAFPFDRVRSVTVMPSATTAQMPEKVLPLAALSTMVAV
jgi:hypothetical protein